MSLFGKEDSVSNMADRITMLEQALKQIADAKKQLYRNTTEAKSRIQCNISRQLEVLRNREVWLLNQLDLVSSAKEEVLQQQSARLNKSLGVLQSSLQFPDSTGDNSMSRKLASLDLGELQPEETPYVSFKSDQGSLRDAIMNYGRIDHTSVPPLHSPFMAPNQPAPSLPRHFEDYNDAEHHILYKTVEEINRNNTAEPCVYVNIPKLSNRLEDWLLYPATTSTSGHNTDPKFTFPKLSNNISDWLKTPISMATSQPVASKMTLTPEQTTLGSRPVGMVEGISTDASIKTWLHKIKQNPFEEEDEDYDFVEEMSDTRTQCSMDMLDRFEDQEGHGRWLSSEPVKNTDDSGESNFKFQNNSLPMDKWLLKSTKPQDDNKNTSLIDMSRYLKNITEELDQWLMNKSTGTQHESTGDMAAVNERLRPEVPASLTLNGWLLSNHLSRSENPWLQRSRSSSKSSSFSTVSSRSSSFSSVASTQKFGSNNKWLLNGGLSEVSATTNIQSSFMDRYKTEMDKYAWVKCDIKQNTATPKSCNPLERYEKEGFEPSNWLKPQTGSLSQFSDMPSPLKKFVDQQNSSPNSAWLQNKNTSLPENPPCFEKAFDSSNKIWLLRPLSPFLENDLEEDLC